VILDLHVHSKYSKDSRLEPEKILKLATARGLGGIAITDHNTVYGGLIARKLSKGDLLVIVGSEIKTERGEVMGLFLNEEIPERSFFDVVDAIRDQGGIVVLPHPFDRLRRSSLLKNKRGMPEFHRLHRGLQFEMHPWRIQSSRRKFCSSAQPSRNRWKRCAPRK